VLDASVVRPPSGSISHVAMGSFVLLNSLAYCVDLSFGFQHFGATVGPSGQVNNVGVYTV